MWSCVCACVWVVDLKQIPRYYSSKMSLFGNHKKCNLSVLIVNHTQIQRTKKRNVLLEGVQRPVVNKDSIERNWEFEVLWLFIGWIIIVFHWLSGYLKKRCSSFFLLEQNRKSSSCWRWKVHLLLFGVMTMNCRTWTLPLQALPTPV